MDSIFIIVFLFLLGMVLIIKGGDFFVDSASWMAEVFGIPKLIVGATIVSLATTLPEMLVSFIAAAEGKADMAVGNAIGTITANVGLIMAVFILFMPTVIKRSDYLVKSILVLAAATTVFLFANDGQYEFESSIILFAIFIIFIVDNVKHALYCMKEKHKHDLEELQESKKFIHRIKIKLGLENEPVSPKVIRYQIGINMLKFILGAAAIVLGADLLTTNGSELARIIGISERVIGVTIIAIGTSLPELVTTVTAIIKKEASLSAGNIIGANIINLTLILPICALLSRGNLPVSSQLIQIDFPACLLVTGISIIPTLITKKFARWQGIIMIGTYIGYILMTTTMVI